ncbi:hypothetical protein PMIN03_007285, partial [Paraphaeosphaeria minitans]
GFVAAGWEGICRCWLGRDLLLLGGRDLSLLVVSITLKRYIFYHRHLERDFWAATRKAKAQEHEASAITQQHITTRRGPDQIFTISVHTLSNAHHTKARQ